MKELVDDLHEVLLNVADVLDNYSDVRDGGQDGPMPNSAMSALAEVERAIRAIERFQARDTDAVL